MNGLWETKYSVLLILTIFELLSLERRLLPYTEILSFKIFSVLTYFPDIWPIPIIQERQQRAVTVYPETTGSGPDDLPEE